MLCLAADEKLPKKIIPLYFLGVISIVSKASWLWRFGLLDFFFYLFLSIPFDKLSIYIELRSILNISNKKDFF